MVATLLTRIPESPSGIFGIACPFMTIDEFTDKCQKVYFSIEDFSDATYILVNAGLYYIFIEQAFGADDLPLKQQYQSFQRLCQINLETALSRLPLFLPGRAESIQALLLGVSDDICCGADENSC